MRNHSTKANVAAFPDINPTKPLGNCSKAVNGGFDLQAFLTYGRLNLRVSLKDGGLAFIDEETGQLVWMLVDCKV